MFGANVLMGDALARVAIAQRILFSRDPHLGAIGFVWSPLPALALLPFIPFKIVWPALVELGFAGNILSATFMAGAVSQVRGFLIDLRVNRIARLTLTASFALHPLIIFYGANAMSEAPFIFFLLISVRQLARWLDRGQLAPLVYAGIALAGLYLTRYEGLAAGIVTLLAVFIVSVSRTTGVRKQRLAIAMLDSLIVGAPFLLAVALWAGLSWLITGLAFEQISSVYGTTAQLRSKGFGAFSPAETLHWLIEGIRSILGLQPFLPVLIIMGAVSAIRLRDLKVLALVAVPGAVLAFALAAYSTGTILRSLRYLIAAIPLGTLLASWPLSSKQTVVDGDEPLNGALPRDPVRGSQTSAPAVERQSRVSVRIRRPIRHGLSLIVIVMVMLALPTGAATLLNPSVNHWEAAPLLAAINRENLTEDQQLASQRFVTDRAIAQYLDDQHLPRGSVLIDDFIGFAIVLASRHPDQFVITSDRDFQTALADPAGSGIHYVLVPPPASALGGLDAINRAYSDLYESGAGIGVLVEAFEDRSDYHYNWRLYSVASSP